MEAVWAHGDGGGYCKGWQNFYSLRHAQQPTGQGSICSKPSLISRTWTWTRTWPKTLYKLAVLQYSASEGLHWNAS